MPDGGDFVQGLQDFGTNVAAPAAIGAGVGAAGAAITGGNPGTGALIGGATGGVGGGINWAAGGPDVVASTLGLNSQPGVPGDVTAAGAGAGTSGITLPGGGGGGSGASSFTGGGGGAPIDPTSGAGASNVSSQLDLTGRDYQNPDLIGTGQVAPGPKPDQSPGMVDRILNSLGVSGSKPLGDHPLSTAIGGAGLLYSTAANRAPAGTSNLTNEANALAAEGSQLSSAINTGNLPPGARQAIDQATMSAKTAIRSKYAAMGQSGSTSEVQELNAVDERAAAQTFDFANQLLKQGSDLTGLSSQIYQKLIGLDTTRSQSIGTAIANFAAAASGFGGGGTRPKTAANDTTDQAA